MKKLNFIFVLIATYLVIFAAFSMHRTSSGYKRPFSFKRIKPVRKLVYQDVGNEHKLTLLNIEKFSNKSSSEPDKI